MTYSYRKRIALFIVHFGYALVHRGAARHSVSLVRRILTAPQLYSNTRNRNRSHIAVRTDAHKCAETIDTDRRNSLFPRKRVALTLRNYGTIVAIGVRGVF